MGGKHTVRVGDTVYPKTVNEMSDKAHCIDGEDIGQQEYGSYGPDVLEWLD